MSAAAATVGEGYRGDDGDGVRKGARRHRIDRRDLINSGLSLISLIDLKDVLYTGPPFEYIYLAPMSRMYNIRIYTLGCA